MSHLRAFLPTLALEHLKSSLTRDNLWLYLLAELSNGDATPRELRDRVVKTHGFAPAAITFYSVLYKLKREGLVKKSSDAFRSAYSVTDRGKSELANGIGYISDVGSRLKQATGEASQP